MGLCKGRDALLELRRPAHEQGCCGRDSGETGIPLSQTAHSDPGLIGSTYTDVSLSAYPGGGRRMFVMCETKMQGAEPLSQCSSQEMPENSSKSVKVVSRTTMALAEIKGEGSRVETHNPTWAQPRRGWLQLSPQPRRQAKPPPACRHFGRKERSRSEVNGGRFLQAVAARREGPGLGGVRTDWTNHITRTRLRRLIEQDLRRYRFNLNSSHSRILGLAVYAPLAARVCSEGTGLARMFERTVHQSQQTCPPTAMARSLCLLCSLHST